MAISIEDNRLVITSNYQHTGFEEAYFRMLSLMSLLTSVTENDLLDKDDVRNVVNMIEDLMPDLDDFTLLQRMKYPKPSLLK